MDVRDKTRHPVARRRNLGEREFWGPVLQLRLTKRFRDSGPKLLGQRITFSYRLDYSTLRPMSFLGYPNRLGPQQQCHCTIPENHPVL